MLAAGGAEAFSETAEFVRSIQVQQAPKVEDTASYMDVDEQQPAAAVDTDILPPPPADSKPPLPPKVQRKYRKSGWVSAGDADEQVG